MYNVVIKEVACRPTFGGFERAYGKRLYRKKREEATIV